MNKSFLTLAAVIVVLLIAIAFLIGRGRQVVTVTPTSTAISQPVAGIPAAPTLVGHWQASPSGGNFSNDYTFNADGSGSESSRETSTSQPRDMGTFRWSWDGTVLRLSDIRDPSINMEGFPTTVEYGCHLSPDGQSWTMSLDPDKTHPTLDNMPDTVYRRQ